MHFEALGLRWLGCRTRTHELLDATIQHLEALKTGGARFVSVQSETLSALAKPAPRISAQAPSVAAASPPVIAVSSPEPSPVTGDPAKLAAFAELRARALACVKCPHLAAARKNAVFGVGNIDAALMFVGEAPGADEDEQGEPFVGKAGQLLTKIIQTMGQSRQTVYIANIFKMPPRHTGPERRQSQTHAAGNGNLHTLSA